MISYLELALKCAAKSSCHYRVGAVLVRGGRVLAHAYNRPRNHPATDFRHATFHAEEVLLRKAANPRGATAYVARVGSAGTPRMARPCPRCQRALARSGVTLAHYTTAAGPESIRWPPIRLHRT
ncbi:hypothetical protein [Streptomyces sp. NBC_01304]|uniref:hypothetical protein n=1 Tax=Streptomyces sp. NBC_01304 TaxID=2903818 RepID=UPI003FA38197